LHGASPSIEFWYDKDSIDGRKISQERSYRTAEIDIRYVSFQDLGRATAEALDSTVFNPDGSVQKIGTNQAARYAIDTHHLTGPATPQANGYQFSIVGTVIDGGTYP
jgi:hypothetical protein